MAVCSVNGGHTRYRGSNMSAHVLLNLSNEMRKRNKCKFDKFNNTGAQMLDSIYHRTFELLKITFFACKRLYFASFTTKSVNHQWFIDFITWHCISTCRLGVM